MPNKFSPEQQTTTSICPQIPNVAEGCSENGNQITLTGFKMSVPDVCGALFRDPNQAKECVATTNKQIETTGRVTWDVENGILRVYDSGKLGPDGMQGQISVNRAIQALEGKIKSVKETAGIPTATAEFPTPRPTGEAPTATVEPTLIGKTITYTEAKNQMNQAQSFGVLVYGGVGLLVLIAAAKWQIDRNGRTKRAKKEAAKISQEQLNRQREISKLESRLDRRHGQNEASLKKELHNRQKEASDQVEMAESNRTRRYRKTLEAQREAEIKLAKERDAIDEIFDGMMENPHLATMGQDAVRSLAQIRYIKANPESIHAGAAAKVAIDEDDHKTKIKFNPDSSTEARRLHRLRNGQD